MESREPSEHAVALGKFLLASGAFLLVLALLADPGIVARFHFRTPLSSEALTETAKSRAVFGLGAAALLAAGVLLLRSRPSRRPPRWVTRALLASIAGLLPLTVLERAARPFVERLTTLFQPDPELGWKHRPSTEDTYWGARVRINAHGMRGPERDLAKAAGVRRLLVLGDSVVFGLMLEDDSDTFTARLERELSAPAGRVIECLNAAVSGWSTRQERLFLECDGARWLPDLVVLGFVLNDVSGLAGDALVPQLVYSRPEGMPAWLAECGIYLALREHGFRRALAGDSSEAQAHRNRLTPYHVILQPDSAPVQEAWERTLLELEGILAWCRARPVLLVLVAFPFAIQLREPVPAAPQRILDDFSRARGLPYLDLLPSLLSAQRARGLAETDLFLNGMHPSALGNELAAAELARFLVERGILP